MDEHRGVSDAAAQKMGHALVGLYLWEWFISLGFEWDFMIGRKRLRWPMFFYFCNRYLLLGHLIGSLVLWNTKGQHEPINCKALYACLRVFGKGALAFASINLALRTIAIWQRNKYVIAILGVIMLAELSVIFLDMRQVLMTSQWDPRARMCLNKSNNDWLRVVFLISMTFDFIVLVLNVYKIGITTVAVCHSRGQNRKERSILRLTYIVLSQGILYFFFAFCVNAAAVIVVTLPSFSHNNANRAFALPAYVISTVVACRAVRGLTKSGGHLTDISMMLDDPAFEVGNEDSQNCVPTSPRASLTGQVGQQSVEGKDNYTPSPSLPNITFGSTYDLESARSRPSEGGDETVEHKEEV